MLSIVNSMTLLGINGCKIEVQVDVSNGLPSWDIVGLPDTSIKESKERVRTAIKNSGFEVPSKKIVVNLAPANIKKEGAIFDLPMAIGILKNIGIITNENLKEIVFLGELSFDGKINPLIGALPMCIEAKQMGIKKIVLPKQNAKEAGIVNGIEVFGVENLIDTVNFLNGDKKIEKEVVNSEIIFQKRVDNTIDFSEVKGQENVKRALEIAAAGGHNCILIGSPGSGKTMLARRVPTILPDLNFDEALEVTKIHSVAGLLGEKSMITTRPFRSPHHTISKISLVGGGAYPKPGEISLSHCGVLFLDELPEFNKSTLEVMRGPLEDRKILISRVNASFEYPANFMLVASMNPCPCGYYGSKEKECSCSMTMISKYMNKISGPLLDRIDIHVEVSGVKYEKLNSEEKPESSQVIKQRVDRARKKQVERYKQYKIYSNAELTPKLIEKYCTLDDKSKTIMEKVFNKMGLSARSYGRILKVARTIADLDDSENIESKHIAEAVQYRLLDKKYFT